MITKFFYFIYTIKEFYILLIKHLKERWNIDYQIIEKYLKLFSISIIIFILLDYIYINFVIFRNNSFSLFKIKYFDIDIIILESIIFSLILFYKSHMNYYNTIKELKYIYFNIKFSCLVYHCLSDKYFKNLTSNKDKKEINLEYKILNILFIQCFKYYFKNVKYLDSEYILKCIFGFSKLYNHDRTIPNDLKEFYCISFFNPNRKNKLSHHQSFINILKRQINIIARIKSLQIENSRLYELIDFVLTRWYVGVIKFSLR